jgi:hypothetical protein
MSATKGGKQAIKRLLDQARSDLDRAQFWGAQMTITYYEGRIRAFEQALQVLSKPRKKMPGVRGEVTQPGRVNELPSMKKARVA